MKKKITLTDKYIEILEYADQHETFKLEDLYKAVGVNEALKKSIDKRAGLGALFTGDMDTNNKIYFIITKDECFQLLEYRELKEARKSSKIATWFATGALIVSIAALALNILIQCGVL